ncbi:class I SAM-dependent DNA methyltransferase [Tautonia rosea]|uniref:class I SAM-dependent DNA methyltransferase n=1 Tax=Tautonia rosea TaxID=2728037 RepID=UPI0019CFB9F5
MRRFITTPETSKHRFFVFLDGSVLPDNMLVNIALDDAHFLGVLSSRIHVTWALAAGGRLGVGNDPRYNKTRCFDPFPFPDCDDSLKARIRALAESLDAHRKQRQAEHPDLTLTGMYNVLATLRSGAPLTDKERDIHERGLVSVLKQIHDELDEAVFAAYGWPATLSDEEILEHLVALNRERADEERRGLVRWLRPEFQAPDHATTPAAVQGEFPPDPADLAATSAAAVPPSAKRPWPKTLAEQAQALRSLLASLPEPATPADLARHFTKAPRPRVAELLDTLSTLGQARPLPDGRFAPP